MFYTEDSLEVAFFKSNFLNFALKLHYRFRSVEAYAALPLTKKAAEVIKNTITGKWGEHYAALLTTCDIEKSQFSVFSTMVVITMKIPPYW